MRRPGPDEWRELLGEYKASGLTQKEFAAKHDVSLSTLTYWLYKRSKLESKIDVNSGPHFLPLEVVASPASSTRAGSEAAMEMMLREGVALRFAVGTDVRYLSALLAALR